MSGMSERDLGAPPPPDSLPPCRAIGGAEIPLELLLHIDPDAVRGDFEHAAAWQASVSYAAALARLAVERKKREIKELESRKFIQMRDMLEEKLGKAPGEYLVEHNVTADPEVCAAHRKLFDMRARHEALESARFALYARRDLLISMGAETRLDRRMNPSHGYPGAT